MKQQIKPFSIVLLIFGTIFTGYYILCGFLAGFHVSMLWVWLLLGLLCIGKGLWELLRKEKSNGKTAQVLTVVARSIISILLAVFVLEEGFVLSGMVKQPKPHLDYIVVLGARVFGTEPSPILQYRIDAAYEYLMENPETVAIVSGGQGDNEPCTESSAMKNWLVSHGMDPERILEEDQSKNTRQNLAFSKKMIPEGASVGIVSSDFHICRALHLAETLGYDTVCGIPARGDLPTQPSNLLREFFAVVKDFWIL